MRNLQTSRDRRVHVNSSASGENEWIWILPISREETVLVARNGCLVHVSTEMSSLHRSHCGVVFNPSISTDESPPVFDPDVEVIDASFLAERSELILCSRYGDIVSYNVLAQTFETVGAFDTTLTCASWSPDQELLILGTAQGSLLMMTKEFEMIVECNAADPTASNVINRDSVKVASNDHSISLSTEVQSAMIPVSISWRGDGEYFAVMTSNREHRHLDFRHQCQDETDSITFRRLFIFDRSGERTAVGVNQSLMEASCSWRPSGSLIACAYHHPGKKQSSIVFYERNGLQHYEFPLVSSSDQCFVHSISWNTSSELLAVHHTRKGDMFPSVDIYYRNNYHWYRKQTVSLISGVSSFSWDPEFPLVLHVVGCDGTYSRQEYRWDTCLSPGVSPNNWSSAAVIDNDRVLVTHFRYAVVPPPMSATTLSIPTALDASSSESSSPPGKSLFVSHSSPSVNAVFQSQGGFVFVMDSWKRLVVFKRPSVSQMEIGDAIEAPYELIAVIPFYDILMEHLLSEGFAYDATLLSIYEYEMVSETAFIAALSPLPNSDQPILIHCSLSMVGLIESIRIVRLPRSQLHGDEILAISHHWLSNITFVELRDGSILFADLSQDQVLFAESGKFNVPCPRMRVCRVGSDDVLFGLGQRGHLCAVSARSSFSQSSKSGSHSSILWTAECNSFELHDAFLLFTTFSHELRIAPFSQSLVSSWNAFQTSHSEQWVFKRQVERGALLVCCVPHSTRVILQMPRGNLEGLHPRPLVLLSVEEALTSHRFRKAVLTCRKQRIDMNILFDFSPQILENYAIEFVKQVDSVDDFNIFLSQLRDEDTTKTLFLHMGDVSDVGLRIQSKSNLDRIEDSIRLGKVNHVCHILRTAMREIDPVRYRLAIVTTFVRQSPPNLDDALRTVHWTRETLGDSEAEDMLKYLAVLTDMTLLYSTALGLYDLKLALLVANSSQMDPKEYLPFLRGLQDYEDTVRKYKIDLHLKRYDRALRNLISCGPEYYEEVVQLAEKCRLQEIALEFFSSTDTRFISGDVSVHDALVLSLARRYVSDAKLLSAEARDKLPTELRKQDVYRSREAEVVPAPKPSKGSKGGSGLPPAPKKTFDELYGEASEKFSMSALLFLQVRPPHVLEAVDAYADAGEVREVESLISSLTSGFISGIENDSKSLRSGEVISEIGYRMGFVNRIRKRYRDAAMSYADFAQDVEESISCLLEGHQWTEAISFSRRCKRSDLIQTDIQPALIQYASEVIDSLRKDGERFQRKLERLERVRDHLHEHGLGYSEFQEDMPEAGVAGGIQNPNSDSFSDTSSGAWSDLSSSSESSTASSISSTESRVAARKFKKRSQAKSGPEFEEEKVILSLESMIPSVERQVEIGACCRALLQFGRPDLAASVQEELVSLLDIVRAPIADGLLRYHPLRLDSTQGSLRYLDELRGVEHLVEADGWKLPLMHV